MRVNNLLYVIYYASKKWRRRDLNLRPTDPETDTTPRGLCGSIVNHSRYSDLSMW
jgi:hypothetical protein